jgi:tRNA pseudouridine38-40 synthase
MENSWRIRMLVSYDGTGYAGWQIQVGGPSTIQQVIEEAASKLFDHPVRVVGSGRTDAGVHAVGQVCHFDVKKDPTRYNLTYALRRNLPPSIVPRRTWLAPHDFHAQRSAVDKTYQYRILNTPQPNPFDVRFASWYRQPLDADVLQLFADKIHGKHDFMSFQSQGEEDRTTVREIFECRWERKGKLVLCSVRGSGFLKQMVRNLVGTMIGLYLKGQSPQDFEDILKACDRRLALAPAPAEGLFLKSVRYPPHLDNKCRKL